MSKPQGPKCYFPRLEMTMKEIPDKYHEVLWELTGRGKPPVVVQAAISYIEGNSTQYDCAEAFGVDDSSIRKTVEDIVDEGVVSLEYVRKNCKRAGKGQFGESTNDNRIWKPKV